MHTDVVFASALVGVLVGMTGAGGGALMTPMLMLVFSVKPAAAIPSGGRTSTSVRSSSAARPSGPRTAPPGPAPAPPPPPAPAPPPPPPPPRPPRLENRRTAKTGRELLPAAVRRHRQRPRQSERLGGTTGL